MFRRFNPPLWDERTVAFERTHWEQCNRRTLLNGQTTTGTLLAVMLASSVIAAAVANALQIMQSHD